MDFGRESAQASRPEELNPVLSNRYAIVEERQGSQNQEDKDDSLSLKREDVCNGFRHDTQLRQPWRLSCQESLFLPDGVNHHCQKDKHQIGT